MVELILFIIAVVIASFIINSLILFFVGRLTSQEKKNIAIFGALIIIPTWIAIYFIYSFIYVNDPGDSILFIYIIFSFLFTFFILKKATSSYVKNISATKSVISRISLIGANIVLVSYIILLSSNVQKPRSHFAANFMAQAAGSVSGLVSMCGEKDITLPDDFDRIDFVNIKDQSCGPLGKGTFTVIAKWKLENKDCTATITETGASFFGRDCR